MNKWPMLTERRRKEITSLGRKKYRRLLGQTMIEGVRAVGAALAASADLLEVLVTHEGAGESSVLPLLEEARRASVDVHLVDARTMRQLADVESPQPILAVARTRLATLEALSRHKWVLALDAVQDPGNVGTLLRTAAWFGIGGVALGPGTADVFSPKVVRATMGALWALDLMESVALADTLAALRHQEYVVYGADLEGTSIRSWKPASRSVLVLGSEGHGLADATKRQLDATVTIPGAHRSPTAESLNVATAGAVLMYEWTG